jgi:hypothetical protein
MVLIDEVREDFHISQNDLQSMISGEPIAVAHGHRRNRARAAPCGCSPSLSWRQANAPCVRWNARVRPRFERLRRDGLLDFVPCPDGDPDRIVITNPPPGRALDELLDGAGMRIYCRPVRAESDDCCALM